MFLVLSSLAGDDLPDSLLHLLPLLLVDEVCQSDEVLIVLARMLQVTNTVMDDGLSLPLCSGISAVTPQVSECTSRRP